MLLSGTGMEGADFVCSSGKSFEVLGFGRLKLHARRRITCGNEAELDSHQMKIVAMAVEA